MITLSIKYRSLRIHKKERNMDELVKLVSEKSGLDKEMSETVVKLVLDYVKDKLPAPLAAQLDGVLGAGSAADMLGGLFGKK